VIDISLISTIFRELTSSSEFDRVPESCLVMDEPAAVAAFVRAGEPNGVLSGVYAYHLAQSCAAIRPGDAVLDLGCGPANLLVAAARLNPGAHFVGVDLSAGMLDEGRKLIEAAGLQNVELRLDDITKLDSVADGSIDVVLSSMALHHLSDTASLEDCMAAVDRVLAPGGRVYICDFGRLKRVRTVEYFVRRAIPEDEPILGRDYYESLKAAFSKLEIKSALSRLTKHKLRLHSTPVSPIMLVIKTDYDPALAAPTRTEIERMIKRLPRRRRQDLWQLRLFFRMGGLKWVI